MLYFLMRKTSFFFSMLLVVSACAPKFSKPNTTTQELITEPVIAGTWILRSVLMGDAMDVPCGFFNEGKVHEMNVVFHPQTVSNEVKLQVTGQSSVNQFMGTYTILSFDRATQIGKIKMGPLVVTKMAASNPDFMECEKRYLSYLEHAADFKLEGNQLQLIKSFPLPNDGKGNIPFGESYKTILYLNKK